jgi:hypothetical protein
LAANNVTLQEVVIDGVTQHGVSVETTTSALKMLVDATTIRSNAGHGINAFPILPSTLNLTVNNSTFAYLGQNGLNLADNVKATATNSVFTASANGVLASNAVLYLKGCTINYNTTAGIRSQSGANVIMHSVSVTGNATGISNAATVTSVTGTNSITANTVDGAPNAFAAPV